MRPAALFQVIACIALLAATGSGISQTFACAETIDGMVAKADTVFVGEIIATTGDHGSDVFGHDWRGVELHVSDVLKGRAAPGAQWNLAREIGSHTRGISLRELEQWRNNGERLLILVESDKKGNRWPSLGTVVDLGDSSVRMWTADFQQLHGGGQVLSAAQEEAKRLTEEGPADVVCIDKPKLDFSGTDLADPMMRGLNVPADERLDQRARAIISGELVTPYGEDSRYLAVEALGHRSTVSNRAFLTQILHGDGGRLRWGAYEALKKMGVVVTPPAS